MLAALHTASQQGGFDYQVTDSYFPGMGFFVTSIGETAGSGTTGWSYRVWNDEIAASPQVSVERFLLGYESTGLALPHTEVLFYWGYASRCLPLRVTPVQETVQCGYPLSVLVEAFVNDGSLSGYWLPVEGAAVCVGEECRITDEEGIAEVVFSAEGTYHLDARAGYDGDSYYVPAGGRTSVDVHGPCVVVSFTVVDHGDPGVQFGYVVPGTEGTPELGQTEEHGAVTLVVGEETTIDCLVQLRANGGLAGDGTEIPLSAITWATDSSGTSAEAMPIDYVTIGPAPAGQTTTYDVWHWLSVPGDQPLGLYESRFYYRVTDEEP